jgi:penicillin amidase
MADRIAGRGWTRWAARIGAALGLAVLAVIVAVWFFLRGSMAQLNGAHAAPGLAASVSVARDAHGVPVIAGADRLDVAYATGFVHAQERYFQMDLLRRVAAGELAELFGPRAVPIDRAHRLHRFRARAALALQALAPPERQLLERYAAGVNDGLSSLTARPFEYALVAQAPRPWTPADSLLVIWAMYFDLQGGQEARALARGWLSEHATPAQLAFLLPAATRWDAPLDDAPAPADAAIPARAPEWWGADGGGRGRMALASNAGTDDTDTLLALNEQPETRSNIGSNNWAVAGSRSGGGAIVSDDMHLGLQLPNIWYRLALQFPYNGGIRRIVGVSLPGAPAIVVGSNGHVAWGFTNSAGNYADLVPLEKDAGKPDQLKTPAGWETPLRFEETILVKGGAAQRLTVRETSFGPVREAGGALYASHWAAHAPQAVNLNLRKMETADTLDDALAAAAGFGMPAQNMIAGDERGNIGWTIAGPLPRREHGAAWSGFLSPADYPRVINPPGGQLWTANSRQLMGAGSALIGDGGFDLGARSRQVRDDLRALGARTDIKAVYGVTLDDRAIYMATWRDRAIAALSGDAVTGHAQRAEFLRLLKTGWSGRASPDSAGYRLARGFEFALYDLLFGAADRDMALLDAKASMGAATARWPAVVERLLDERPPGWLPPRYASWQALELAAVDLTIAELGSNGKPLADATWGRRNAAAIAHPIASALPLLDYWLKAPADSLPGDGNMPRVAGPNFGQSERLTVTPGKEEQGIFNMPGGQSGHPLSPYFLDGQAAWVKGEATPLLPGAPVHVLKLVK